MALMPTNILALYIIIDITLIKFRTKMICCLNYAIRDQISSDKLMAITGIILVKFDPHFD